MQADVFNAEIVKLESEQGPAMGAAMLATYGRGWFPSLQDCAKAFCGRHARILPIRRRFKLMTNCLDSIKAYTEQRVNLAQSCPDSGITL